MCNQQKKSWLQPFWRRKLLFLSPSCTGIWQWTLTANHKVWMQAFVKHVPQEKRKKCFSSIQRMATHKCTHHCNHHKMQMDSLHHSPHSPDQVHQIFISQPAGTPLHRWWGTAKHCLPVVTEEAEKVLGKNTCPWPKVEEYCCQKWRICWKRNCFSNGVIKFCEMFTCLTWKWYEIT